MSSSKVHFANTDTSPLPGAIAQCERNCQEKIGRTTYCSGILISKQHYVLVGVEGGQEEDCILVRVESQSWLQGVMPDFSLARCRNNRNLETEYQADATQGLARTSRPPNFSCGRAFLFCTVKYELSTAWSFSLCGLSMDITHTPR